MKTIPAKPTVYKGVKYDSRLEARWAVFFDEFFTTKKTSFILRHPHPPISVGDGLCNTGYFWQEGYQRYSGDGYSLSDKTKYKPDFWVNVLHVEVGAHGPVMMAIMSAVIEIKPIMPNKEYIKRLSSLWESEDLASDRRGFGLAICLVVGLPGKEKVFAVSRSGEVIEAKNIVHFLYPVDCEADGAAEALVNINQNFANVANQYRFDLEGSDQ